MDPNVISILVLLRESLSNFPRPLERLVAKLGEELAVKANSRDLRKRKGDVSGGSSYRPNRKLLPEETQELVELYQAGSSIEALAKRYGMHPQTVGRHLKRQGVAKRPLRKLSADQVGRAARLYGEGWSTTDLAKEFEVCQPTIRTALIRAGVALRAPAEGRWHTRKTPGNDGKK